MDTESKLWGILLLLSYTCWNTDATADDEGETTLNPNKYSPQFLRDDELPTEQPAETIDETATDNIERRSIVDDEESTTLVEITTYKTNEFTTEINSVKDNARSQESLRRLNYDKSTSLNGYKTTGKTEKPTLQEVKSEFLNNTAYLDGVTESINNDSVEPRDTRLHGIIKNSDQGVRNSVESNISVIYSEPYQPGKDLYNADKVTVVYPEEIGALDRAINVESTSTNRQNTTNISLENEHKMDAISQTQATDIVQTTTVIKDDATKERLKQIRHSLYKRRPMTHYLLKVKNNDMSINSNDDSSQNTTTQEYVEVTSTTKKPFNILKKITPDSNFDALDSTVEVVNKMRKRNGLKAEEYPENIDRNDRILEIRAEDAKQNINVTNLYGNASNGDVQKNISTNTSTQSENLYTSETRLHSSIIYDRNTENENGAEADGNLHSLNETGFGLVTKAAIPSNIERDYQTKTPFRPSPMYNPNDIRRYNINYQRLQNVFSNTQNNAGHLNSGRLESVETTTKPTIGQSIVENMMLMLKNLRRLPARQHKRIQVEQNGNGSSLTNNVEIAVENYESMKIRPSLQTNQRSQQNVSPQALLERKDDKLSATNNNTLTSHRDSLLKLTRRPGQFDALRFPTRLPITQNRQIVKSPDNASSNYNNTTLNEGYNSSNSNTQKPLQIVEQILKANILMELDKIRLMMLNKNRLTPVNQTGQIDQTHTSQVETNNLQNNQQPFNFISKIADQHKETTASTIRPKFGNKRLSYLRNRSNKPPSRDETTADTETSVDETNVLESKRNRPIVRQRQRYQESYVSDGYSTTTSRINYRRRPASRGNRLTDVKTDLTGNKTKTVDSMTDNTLKQTPNLRRRNRFKSRNTNEQESGEKQQTESNESKKMLSNNPNITTQDVKFINSDNDNILSTTLSSVGSDQSIHRSVDSDEQSFYNQEFELNGSSSENNATVRNPLKSNNKTDVSVDKRTSNETKASGIIKEDLESLESRRDEKSVYVSRFEPPAGYENGFVPMVFDLGGVIGPVPRARKLRDRSDEQNSIPQLRLPESEDQLKDFNIVSPNLLTNYGDIGRIPQTPNDNARENAENNEKDPDLKQDKHDLKTASTDTTHYDAALKQYNEALKTYNNYLEQFIQNKKPT